MERDVDDEKSWCVDFETMESDCWGRTDGEYLIDGHAGRCGMMVLRDDDGMCSEVVVGAINIFSTCCLSWRWGMGTEGIMHGMEHTVHLEQLHHSLIHHQSTPQRSPRIPFSPDAHLASPNLVLTHPSLSQSVLQASTCLPDLLCPTTQGVSIHGFGRSPLSHIYPFHL
jgi:hypothetical protein